VNGSADGSCPGGKWFYDTCPDKGDTSGGVILGIVLVIGGGLVVVSVVLLVVLVRRLYRQREAKQEIKRHYRHLSRQLCSKCKDGIAVLKCLDCRVRLCTYCADQDVEKHIGSR
jgi:hypothetical protein